MYMSDVKGKEVIWFNFLFYYSSIGIGLVDFKGGGSIYSVIKGSSDLVFFGNFNSMLFGLKNLLLVGIVSSLDFLIVNKVLIGVFIFIGLVNDIKWNMNFNFFSVIDVLKEIMFKSFIIDDSSLVKFVFEFISEIVLKSYFILVGYVDFDLLVVIVKMVKRILCIVIGVYIMVNLVVLMVFFMGVNGQLKDVNYDINKSVVDFC